MKRSFLLDKTFLFLLQGEMDTELVSLLVLGGLCICAMLHSAIELKLQSRVIKLIKVLETCGIWCLNPR